MKKDLQDIITKNESGDFSPKFFETNSKMGAFQKVIHIVTSILEIILTLSLLVGIVLSSVNFPPIYKSIIAGGSAGLKTLIDYVALIIIAIELIHVLNLQNLQSVIEILMIAFTRELVIKEWTVWQLLLGVFCIAGLFATKKYLMGNKEE